MNHYPCTSDDPFGEGPDRHKRSAAAAQQYQQPPQSSSPLFAGIMSNVHSEPQDSADRAASRLLAIAGQFAKAHDDLKRTLNAMKDLRHENAGPKTFQDPLGQITYPYLLVGENRTMIDRQVALDILGPIAQAHRENRDKLGARLMLALSAIDAAT